MLKPHAYNCTQSHWQICLACNAQVCACYGSARGTCPICYRGFLSNYYAPKQCGYKGCTAHAVATTPRVGQACLSHAVERGNYKPPIDLPAPAAGVPSAHTQVVKSLLLR